MGLAILFVLFTLVFQNCTNGWRDMDSPSAISSKVGNSFTQFTEQGDLSSVVQNSPTFTGAVPTLSESVPRLYGNGEGYGGKLTGAYATVDSFNRCGKATTTHVPIREKIEIANGKVFKVIENCEVLSQPKMISLDSVEVQAVEGQLFVLDKQIYQKAEWINASMVPREQSVDTFCRGEKLDSKKSSAKQLAEVFVYKDPKTLTVDLPWQMSPKETQIHDRQAQVLYYELNSQTSTYQRVREAELRLQEIINFNPMAGAATHSLQPGSAPANPLVPDLSYLDGLGAAIDAYVQAQLAHAFASVQIPTVSNPKCWTNE